MPRVSAIIPAYNMGATISRALGSVLAQTFTDYEIICVDDGSTDDTGAVLARYGGRIRVVSQQNRGVSAARNLGARLSSGEYFAFLDADDLWRPDKLKRTVAALDEAPECVVAYSDMATFNADGTEAPPLTEAATAHAPSLKELRTRMWPLLASTLVIRRSAFERAGGFCEELVEFEDTYLCLRLREFGPFRYIAEPLVCYEHPDLAKATRRAMRENAAAHHFARLVEQNYGRRAEGLRRHLARYKANLLSRAGLFALGSGDRRNARRYLSAALGWNPYRVKTYLRLARTFLPARMAAALSGRGVARSAAGTRCA